MWQEKNNNLEREFVFRDFQAAFRFMQAVAAEAENQQHHPRWENNYNKVRIWLNTHENGGQVTEKDRTLAEAIDQIFEIQQADKGGERKTTKVREVKLYTDGGSRGNPGPSASGFVLLDLNDKVLVEHDVYLGITTNNQAEYQALKLGLEEATRMHVNRVQVFMDSLLVVNQMIGKFKIRNRDLWPIHDSIKELVKNFEHVSFTHVPRALNKLADGMVNKALDEKLKV